MQFNKSIVYCQMSVFKASTLRIAARLVKTVTGDNQYELLAFSSTPLWRRPYDQQLQMKQHKMKKALIKMTNILKMKKIKLSDVPHLSTQIESNDGKICPLQEIRASPQILAYRNKDGQNIGASLDGEIVAGHILCREKYGEVCIPNVHSVITTDKHKRICQGLGSFLKQSSLVGEGRQHYTYVTLRTTRTDETMMCLTVRPHRDIPDLIETAKTELEEFMRGSGQNLGITSVYIQESWHGSNSKNPMSRLPVYVFGTEHITEVLLGMRFRVSPMSFFQINTAGAEVLYAAIRELVDVTLDTTVLDICCGTE